MKFRIQINNRNYVVQTSGGQPQAYGQVGWARWVAAAALLLSVRPNNLQLFHVPHTVDNEQREQARVDDDD